MAPRVAANSGHFSVRRQLILQFYKVFLVIFFNSNISQIIDKLLFTEHPFVGVGLIIQLQNSVHVLFLNETQLFHDFHTHKGGEFDCEMRFAFALSHDSDSLFAELEKFVKCLVRYVP